MRSQEAVAAAACEAGVVDRIRALLFASCALALRRSFFANSMRRALRLFFTFSMDCCRSRTSLHACEHYIEGCSHFHIHESHLSLMGRPRRSKLSASLLTRVPAAEGAFSRASASAAGGDREPHAIAAAAQPPSRLFQWKAPCRRSPDVAPNSARCNNSFIIVFYSGQMSIFDYVRRTKSEIESASSQKYFPTSRSPPNTILIFD
jgi:hypothetical protein